MSKNIFPHDNGTAWKSEVPFEIAFDEYNVYRIEAEAAFEEEILTRMQFFAVHYPHLLKDSRAWALAVDDQFSDDIFGMTDLRSAYWDTDIPPDKIVDEVWKPTILERYCKEVADKLQFPHDTAYIFSLGVVASAMTRQFTYRLNKNDEYTRAPVNLYVVTAQPAGTAKSGVFRNFVSPVQMAYAELNERQRKARAKLGAKLEIAKADYKKAINDEEKQAISVEMANIEEELIKTPVYVYAVDDATSEGLRDIAARQLGFFNMVSEEADLLKVLMGNVYGDGARKNNNSMFLKAWDGDIVSVARAGQDVMTTNVKATMAIIAQDEAIRIIMEAGLTGQGVNERVLIHREKDMLDNIDYRKRRASTINSELRAEYHLMISRMVAASDENHDITSFYLSDAASEALIRYMEEMQFRMQHSPILRDPTIMGVVAKGEKQICKLSSVLHACQCFQKNGTQTAEINETTVRRAIGIFDQLTRTYIKAAERNGYAGINPQITAVKEAMEKILKDYRRKPLTLDINLIRDRVKRRMEFQRCVSVAQTLRNEVFPEMERRNLIVIHKNRLYYNPSEFHNG